MTENVHVSPRCQPAHQADVRIGRVQHWPPSSLRPPVAPVADVLPVAKTRSASPIELCADVSRQTSTPETSWNPSRSPAEATQPP